MKILHLGNAYFLGAFRQLGHDVKWAGYHRTADLPLTRSLLHAKDLLAQLPSNWFPDLIVLGDESAQPLVLGLEALPVPLVWYAIDSHIHANWHMHYAAAFDVIAVAQKDWTPVYQIDTDRQRVAWVPLFCQQSDGLDRGFTRNIPLSFVGSHNPARNPDRVNLIQRLQSRTPIVVQSGPYQELFNRSMMVLNQSVANDVNFRVFEAMACGALLITERVGNGFDELFQDRRHCVRYEKGNVDEIVAIVEYYRAHPAEREAIARYGHESVIAAHTSLYRAQELLELAARQPLQEYVAKRQARQVPIRWSMASVYESASRAYGQAAARAEVSIRRQHFMNMTEQYQSLAASIRSRIDSLVAA